MLCSSSYLPKEPERRLASIVSELEKQGMQPGKPLAVVGHSGGAFLAYDAALTRSQAFVHLGSTLNTKGKRWTRIQNFLVLMHIHAAHGLLQL